MPDLETQLHSLAQHRLAQVPDDVVREEPEDRSPQRQGGRRSVFLAAAALIVTIGAVAGVLLARSGDTDIATPDLELAAFGDREVVARDDWTAPATVLTPSTFVVAQVGVDDPIEAAAVDRADQRFRPASTYKLLNALILLEAGVVSDLDETVPWDGVDRAVEAWNRDLSVAEAIDVSAVWVFEALSDMVATEAKSAAVSAADYGNTAIGDGAGAYWLDGELTISALEQLRFLDMLVRGALDHPATDQAAVLDALPSTRVGDTVIQFKTGTVLTGPSPVAWLIGVASNDRGTWVFAHNADLPVVGGEPQPISADDRLDAVVALLTAADAIR